MQHLDHDRLVFLALGESAAESGEATHLDSCDHCRGELETLQHVAGLGTDTQGLVDLPDPPEHLWQSIAAEIRTAEELPSLVTQRGTRPAAAPAGPSAPPARGRRWPRWATTAVTAAAAAALGVVGTLAVLRPGGDPPQPQPAVLASAALSAYGSTPKDASGAARVLGDDQLHLHVANLPEVPGYYEVWLIDPATMRMFSLGTLSKGSGDELLPMPRNVDLRTYSVVDVSAEQYDNKPAHSGDSLLRGTLTG
ncbi:MULTISPECIES: anti-sigma factor [Micromonospora]|uniref:Anti-sigma factor n=1 Tax=Micromonospora solifontis TaxID=2487138 RepID=A0ABX9WJK2_9ACTN|nr:MULTISPECIES: anti-sigma factor [Micromonospora]NES14106.1 anti-sigma factor [Micromonospora sp. PPF5-17B]NES35736.1 anti-sigma factor [Micromonospora solifontis]NES56017.1 anti-sigma factor [Micromonospora sp. PPF5-6]RNM00412.1 anti-sigma factor [Micromonospora solifontis]